MAHLIDKSALVVEIERRRKDWRYGSSIEAKYKREECDDILSFLNTLEVKEINSADSFIEKACKWLKENAYFYVNGYTGSLNDDMLVNEFHKAMEE